MQVESTSIELPDHIGEVQHAEVSLAPGAESGSCWHLHYVAVLSDEPQEGLGNASPQSTKSHHHPQLVYFPAMRWLADFRGDKKTQLMLKVGTAMQG